MRAMWEGRGALRRGDEAHEVGDTESSIRWWRRAARWYLPFAPHVVGAYQRLESLAAEAEAKDDLRTAISAWTGVRSSVRATRSFYTPFEDRLLRADEHIATLMAQIETTADSDKDPAELRDWHYKLLRKDQMPSVAWSIVALLGLALWIGCGFLFALKAVDERDRLRPKAAAYSGAGIVIGLLVWLLGLYFA